MGQNQPQKLVLSRETVRNLTKDELVGVDGGKGLANTKNCPIDTAFTDCTTADTLLLPCKRCCITE